MKKFFTLLHLFLLAIGASLFTSCEKEKLNDVLSNEQYGNVTVSLDAKTEIGTGSDFTLSGAELTVPVTVKFSGATSRAFAIQLAANVDTISTLVTAGTLPTGTLPLTSGSFSIPSVLNVPIGVTSATFNLLVSRSFLEINYGKTVSVVVTMVNSAKGNNIVSGKGSAIITIKTAEAIAADAVHYIGFNSTTLSVPNNNNFTLGSQDLVIDLPISVSGIPGSGFTVDVVKDAAVANALISSGAITDAAVMPDNKFGIGLGKVIFNQSTGTSKLQLSTNFIDLLSKTDKKWLVGLTLTNPTKYQTSATKKSIVVVIDANYLTKPYIGSEPALVRPYTGKPFLIFGTVGKVSERIPAAIFDLGGEGIGYHNNNQSKNGAGAFRPSEYVDVVDQIPREAVGWTESNEWLNFTIEVEADGVYDLQSYIGSSNTDGRYSIFIDGVDKTGILSSRKTADGTYGNYQPHLSTFSLKKGRHIMKFFMNRGAYDVQGFQFTRKS